MATEEYTQPRPAEQLVRQAEQAGVRAGRAYAAVVSGLTAPIRKPATPTWHWRLAHRAGSGLRAAVDHGVDGLERRARTAPARLLDGLKRLFKAGKDVEWRALTGRASATAFVGWWGWTWAADAGMSGRLIVWAAAGIGLVVVYVAGSEPAKRSLTRREKAQQNSAVRALLTSINTMLQTAPGLHLADLADQITGRSQALGTPVKASVASLRALLEPLGVPIRPQLALGEHNRPGIHAGDWRVWIARHQTPATPSRVGEEKAPTREGALPPAEIAAETFPLDPPKPQVTEGGLEISVRDLGQDEPSGEGLPAPYTDDQLQLLNHVRTAIGTARGAHLRDILTTAQTAGDATGWTVTRLRRELEALDIRVEDKLWLNGGNTRGVLATSLPTTGEETL